MADFADSFSQPDDDSVPAAESTRPFDGDDSYLHFDSFAANHHVAADSDGVQFSPEANGKSFDGGFGDTDGPILPPPSEMGAEEGFALLEWRRENAIRLEEKEKKERELLIQIMEEADEYKIDFYRRREITCENNKAANREKEKLSNAIHEKFHAEADKNYWKAIAELIPNEVPTIQKRGKKDQEKKPSVAVIQGPKPGKPTELSRMRQILLKLKHNTPPHLKHSPPAPPPAKDAKASGSTAAAPAKAAAVVTTSEAVAVA